MPPPPFVTLLATIASDGLSWSRFGPTLPVACAAASVWQEAQFCLKSIALFAVPPVVALVVVVGMVLPRAPRRNAITSVVCPLRPGSWPR